MKFLDKLALNRLIQTLSHFIIRIIEIVTLKKDPKIDVKPDRKPILPWRRKKNEKST